MADAVKVLESTRAMLRVIADGTLTEECVADVARVMDADVKRTITNGTDAYGKPWEPNKDGSSFTFVKSSDVVTGAIGHTIITRIKSRTAVLHHYGRANGKVQRPILPIGKLPPRMINAIKAAIGRRTKAVVDRGVP